jgi:hypothetical protein
VDLSLLQSSDPSTNQRVLLDPFSSPNRFVCKLRQLIDDELLAARRAAAASMKAFELAVPFPRVSGAPPQPLLHSLIKRHLTSLFSRPLQIAGGELKSCVLVNLSTEEAAADPHREREQRGSFQALHE